MPDDPPLSAPIDRDRPPPFHEMSGYPQRFELLTADILQLEPDVYRARLYAPSGESQFGIDVIAELMGGIGVDVASCKCQGEVRPHEWKEWSDAFLDCWEAHWATRRVRRLIVVVAAEGIDTHRHMRAQEVERLRFEALGLRYEIWSPRDLEQRLRQDRGLASRRIGKDWADLICGPDPAAAGFADSAARAQAVALHGAHQSIGELARERVLAAVEDLHCGERERVEATIRSLRDPQTWLQLPADIQASVARLQGSLALQREDRATAVAFNSEAIALDATVRRLAAALAETPAQSLVALGAPVSIEDRCAAAMYRLADGQTDGAGADLDALVAEAPDNAEVYRLIAWQRLGLDDRDGALAAIDTAEALAPRRLPILRLAAITRYSLAMSPMAEVGRFMRPYPTPDQFIRSDDRSRALLEEAAGRIDAVLQKGGVHEDRLWKLALFCNIPGRLTDAQSVCDEILKGAPGDTLAIGWAFMHGLEFDHAAARTAVMRTFEGGGLHESDMNVLIWLLIEAMTRLEAADYVEAHLARQPAEIAEEVASAIRALRDEPPASVEDATLVDLAKLTHGTDEDVDWSTLESRLADLFAPGQPGLPALMFAGAVAQRGRWSALAPYLDAVAGFATTQAIDLAAHIAHHTREPAEILEFLRQHRGAYPGAVMPTALRRMETLALQAVGDLPEALRLAEILSAETGAREDRLNLIQLHLAAGHVAGARPLMRRALDENQLKPGDAIRFCNVLIGEDPPFATELWRFAVGQGVPEDLLLHAYGQAFALGLDKEPDTAILSARVQARAAAGADDVWAMNVDDVVEHVLKRRSEAEKVISQVESGAIPVHLALGSLDSLARIYRLDHPANRGGPLNAIYLRHGGRPVEAPTPGPWSGWQILLDVTGLLIADQLDLLRFVEGLAAPVIISSHLADSLYQLEQQAAPHQPSLPAAARKQLAALGDRRLAVLASDDMASVLTVRHAVDDPTDLSLDQVVGTLRALGDLGGSAEEGEPDAELHPSPNALLLFEEETLTSLTVDGLLEPLLARFQCRLLADEVERLHALVRDAEDRAALAERIRRLRDRVARGLQSGRYVPVKQPMDSANDAEIKAAKFGAIAAGLVDLLKAPAAPNGVLWADDRHLSGYPKTDGNLIVGVVEVLNALVEAGLLTPEDRRQRLSRLRAAGAMFIPFDATEVLTPLKAARIRDGALIETPDLAVLRRSFAAALLRDVHLKFGPTEDPQLNGRPDEVPYLLTSRSVLEKCLRDVWCDPSADLTTRRARSDWLWSNLRMSHGVRALGSGEAERGNDGLAALLVAGAIATGTLIIMKSTRESLKRQEEFQAWLDEAAVRPRLNDGRFLDLVASQIREMLAFDNSRRTSDQVQAMREIRQVQTQMMPPAIRDRLMVHPAYADDLGMGVEQIQSMGDTDFRHLEFWRACARALRRGRATLSTRAGDKVTIVADGETLVFSGGFAARVNDAMFPALKARGADRAEAVERWLPGLDLDPKNESRFHAAFRAARTDAAFVEAMIDASAASVVRHYEDMARAFRGRKNPNTLTFRPPPAMALLHHLRLGDRSSTIAERVAAAWPALEAAIGRDAAFLRLSGLPVRLGDVLADTGMEVAAFERLESTATQIGRLHLARAMLLVGDDKRLSASMGAAVTAASGEAEVFLILLAWTEVAFAADADWQALPAAERLALVWGHAGRVMAVLKSVGITDWTYAKEFFAKSPLPRTVGAALRRDPDYDRDAAAPAHLESASLLFHGLGYVFGQANAFEGVPAEHHLALCALMAAIDVEQAVPHADISKRRMGMPNALGGFLMDWPRGLFEPDDLPVTSRARHLELAFAAIEKDPTDTLAWAVVSALAETGLEPPFADRAAAMFEATSLEALARSGQGLNLCRVAVSTRRRIQPPLADESLWKKLHALGQDMAKVYPTMASLETGDGQACAQHAIEMLGACAHASSGAEALERLRVASGVLAAGWPAISSALRKTFDHLARQAPPGEAAPIWSAFTALQTFA